MYEPYNLVFCGKCFNRVPFQTINRVSYSIFSLDLRYSQKTIPLPLSLSTIKVIWRLDSLLRPDLNTQEKNENQFYVNISLIAGKRLWKSPRKNLLSNEPKVESIRKPNFIIVIILLPQMDRWNVGRHCVALFMRRSVRESERRFQKSNKR
jgi:hypothetical protein